MYQLLENIVNAVPLNLTKKQQYLSQARKVIAEACSKESNCIDIGTRKGEMLDIMLKRAPLGKHHGFEPIPTRYEALIRKYAGKRNCLMHSYALSNIKGTTTFEVEVPDTSNNGKEEQDEQYVPDTTIEVQTEVLDDILPSGYKPELVKIDAAGSVLQILEGTIQTLKEHKPPVIFRYYQGNAHPEKIYELFASCTMRISTMQRWLNNRPCFRKEEFTEHCRQRKDYYFIAYP